ncbi:type IIL restriction-modification enzyme MmeI [Vulcaniibacterium gelatinicum]|uniref:type IIL restriction-modification enzyme MmeI n=1 Tax=Vulcaniibacterium gelatinicum TaxID=2598725 RepID=UPI0011C7AC6C|nr:type IIL restriction-modification enzyme MmeI [Vulcaniibacterium gelatinicum]
MYEKKAERFGKTGKGRIDVFWPGTLLAEHKSAGQDLDAAFEQATDYFAGLSEEELPRYVVVSDFRSFRLHDLDEGSVTQFALAELPKHIACPLRCVTSCYALFGGRLSNSKNLKKQ